MFKFPAQQSDWLDLFKNLEIDSRAEENCSSEALCCLYWYIHLVSSLMNTRNLKRKNRLFYFYDHLQKACFQYLSHVREVFCV